MGGRKTGNLAQEPPDPEMLRSRRPAARGGEGVGDFFERGLAINSGRLETAHIPYFFCVVCCMFAFLRTFTS